MMRLWATNCCGVVRAFSVRRKLPDVCPDCGKSNRDMPMTLWQEVDSR